MGHIGTCVWPDTCREDTRMNTDEWDRMDMQVQVSVPVPPMDSPVPKLISFLSTTARFLERR